MPSVSPPSLWICANTETALARMAAVFGAAKPHCAYLFDNRRATRMKVLVHDGIGVWLAARRMAQTRRKFFELHATNKSQIAQQGLRYIQLLYEIESEVRDLEPDLQCRIRQEKALPAMDRLHTWMIAQRDVVPKGSAISRAIDYSLKH